MIERASARVGLAVAAALALAVAYQLGLRVQRERTYQRGLARIGRPRKEQS